MAVSASKPTTRASRARSLAGRILDRVPYIGPLRKALRDQGEYLAGHFYSPIPAREEVINRLRLLQAKPPASFAGIELDLQAMCAWLESCLPLYAQLPFPDHPAPNCRFYFDNTWFSHLDAVTLFLWLREKKPRRVVEVGSGYSSAVTLDTADSAPEWSPEITFIEPRPQRLRELLRPTDASRVRIMERDVRDVDLSIFQSLEPGDLLFIDTSHVVKCGSDVHFFFFEVFPLIQPGVFVHLHDIFYPFEYSEEFLSAGRYYNEIYFLRAFLMYNPYWKIRFWVDYVYAKRFDWLKQHMPLAARGRGGSIYLERVP